jgi:cytidylate kinase
MRTDETGGIALSILTISRQMGSFGDEIAEALARKLDWDLIDRNQLIPRFFADISDSREKHLLNESAKFFLSETRNGGTYLDVLKAGLFELAAKQSAILVGFGSQIIFGDERDSLHVRITAPLKTRQNRIRKQFHVSESEAIQIIETADRKHKRFVSAVYGIDLTDASSYDLTLNTSQLSVDECVTAILSLQREHEQRIKAEQESKHDDSIDHQTDVPVFKNPSEADFAKILDMYQIDWKYEPKTFPVEWDAEGNVTLAFSPDFYLTKFNTYLELTTMSQKYVTQKNKKMKKMRELYPGTNVKIIYKKDFYSLIDRFRVGNGDS